MITTVTALTFQSYNKCFRSDIFLVLDILFNLGCLQCIMKKALFLHFLRSLLITLSLEKEIVVLEESMEKS